jgi:hypothetical protein
MCSKDWLVLKNVIAPPTVFVVMTVFCEVGVKFLNNCFQWRYSLISVKAALFLRFVAHTHLDTHTLTTGRTPLDE